MKQSMVVLAALALPSLAALAQPLTPNAAPSVAPRAGRRTNARARLDPAALVVAARGELATFTPLEQQLRRSAAGARRSGQIVRANCVERYHELVREAFTRIANMLAWMERMRTASRQQGPQGRLAAGIADRYVRIQLVKAEIVALAAEARACGAPYSVGEVRATVEAPELPARQLDPREPLGSTVNRPPLASPFREP